MANRVFRETMQRSNCKHCLPTWFPNERDENKGRLGYSCELEEWDDLTICRKGYCRYYHNEQHLPADMVPVGFKENKTMKKYIRCHIVEAMPMTRGAYNKKRGWTTPENEDPKDRGYYVKYPDGYFSCGDLKEVCFSAGELDALGATKKEKP